MRTSLPFLFDSHCHFDFDTFGDAEHRKALWQECRQKGINRLLIPGIAPNQWGVAYSITEALEDIYMAVGVHPWWLESIDGDSISEELLNTVKYYLAQPACLAVGECGLDAVINTDFSKQLSIFEQQIELACEVSLPLIIHVRKTHNETLRLLSRYRPKAGGVIHAFSGSAELAKQYWNLGFYLGIGGGITYPRANKTRTAVQEVPLESLLLETDAPDMPLYGFQGQANSPLHLLDIAQVLAELRQEPIARICELTSANANRLFNL